MPLCFVKSFAEVGRRGGGVREREYLHDALAHLSGVRHAEDHDKGPIVTLTKFEPWLASFRELALAKNYQPFNSRP